MLQGHPAVMMMQSVLTLKDRTTVLVRPVIMGMGFIVKVSFFVVLHSSVGMIVETKFIFSECVNTNRSYNCIGKPGY